MRYNQLSRIERLHDEMDKLFHRMFRDTNTNMLDYTEGKKELVPKVLQPGFRIPRIDLRETETSVISRVELPGINKEDIQLNLTDHALEIKVEKKAEQKLEKGKTSCYSKSLSNFYRKLSLPTEVNPEEVKAKYENGILNIEIPKLKKLKDKKKRISIE
jgi:HSP20 family protein